jgi:hypothetical protein
MKVSFTCIIEQQKCVVQALTEDQDIIVQTHVIADYCERLRQASNDYDNTSWTFDLLYDATFDREHGRALLLIADRVHREKLSVFLFARAELNVYPLDLIEKVRKLAQNETFTWQHAADFIRAGRLKRYKNVLSELVSRPNHTSSSANQIVIHEESQQYAFWMAAIQYALPLESAKLISFCVATHPMNLDYLACEMLIQIVHEQDIDTLNRVQTRLASIHQEIPDTWFDDFAEQALLTKADDLPDFHRFVERLSAAHMYRQLEAVYRLYMLTRFSADQQLPKGQTTIAWQYALADLNDEAILSLYELLRDKLPTLLPERSIEEMQLMMNWLLKCANVQDDVQIVKQAMQLYLQFLLPFLFSSRSSDSVTWQAIDGQIQSMFAAHREMWSDLWLASEHAQTLQNMISTHDQHHHLLYLLKKLEEAIASKQLDWNEYFFSTSSNMLSVIFRSLSDLEQAESEKLLTRVFTRFRDDWRAQLKFALWLLDQYPTTTDQVHPMLITSIHEILAALWHKEDGAYHELLLELLAKLLQLKKYRYVSQEILALARGQQGCSLIRFWAERIRLLDRTYNDLETETVIGQYLLIQKSQLEAAKYLQEIRYFLEYYLDYLRPDQKTKDMIANFEQTLDPLDYRQYDLLFLQDLHQYKRKHNVVTYPDYVALAYFLHLLEVSANHVDDEQIFLEISQKIGQIQMQGLSDEQWQHIVPLVCDRAAVFFFVSEHCSAFLGLFQTRSMNKVESQCLRAAQEQLQQAKNVAPMYALFLFEAERIGKIEVDHPLRNQLLQRWSEVIATFSVQSSQMLSAEIKQRSPKWWPLWLEMVDIAKRRRSLAWLEWLKKMFR